MWTKSIFSRKSYNQIFFVLTMIFSCFANAASIPTDLVLNGSQIRLRANPLWGNAIYSLTWNGIEFLNRHDNGRLLQVAWQEDGLVEQRNPTEGGEIGACMKDYTCGSWPLSCQSGSSNSTGSTSGATLSTSANPAYWIPEGCTSAYTESKATGLVSPSLITKNVTVDYLGNPHLIKWDVSINFQNQMTLAGKSEPRNQISVASLFVNPVFRNFYTYDAGSKKLDTLLLAQGKIIDPIDEPRLRPLHGGVIITTDDKRYSIGLYGDSQNLNDGYNMGPNDVTWAAANYTSNPSAALDPVSENTNFLGSITRYNYGNTIKTFTVYVVVGTMLEVLEGMDVLYSQTTGAIPPPITPPAPPPITPSELFRVGVAGYISNGSSYCAISSVEQLLGCGYSVAQYSSSPSYNQTPSTLNANGVCSCGSSPQVCTSFTYNSWEVCQANGTQSRSISSSSPTGCSGGSPITSQSCLPPGLFRVGVAGYISNGSSYCAISSVEQLLGCGYSVAQYSSSPSYNQTPSTLNANGVCSCGL